MTKMITVRKAKEESKRLQAYIALAESYEADTLAKLIIKEYAFSNSVAEIVRLFERRGIMKDGKPFEHKDIVAVIRSTAKDELHKIVKSSYLSKTRHNRTKM